MFDGAAVEATTGKFPALTVDMDQEIALGSEMAIALRAVVKSVQHTVIGGVLTRVHVFSVTECELQHVHHMDAVMDGDAECSCGYVGPDGEGTWVGSVWICPACEK